MIEVICKNCGKKSQSKIKKNFCDRKCYYNYTYNKNKVYIKKTCLICDKNFETTYKNKKYCSTKCASKAEKILREMYEKNIKMSIEDYLDKNPRQETTNDNKFLHTYRDFENQNQKAYFRKIDSDEATEKSYYGYKNFDCTYKTKQQSELSNEVFNHYVKNDVIVFFEKINEV